MFNDQAIRFLSEVTGQKLIFPFYHTISDKPLPHLENLYPVKSIAEFEKDLIFLLRNFKPIELSEITDCKYVRERSFHLTFDDGFSEIYTVIAPLLLKYGIPASFYVSTAFIDNQEIMFRCKASLLVDSIKTNKYSAITLNEVAKKLSLPKESSKIFSSILSISYNKSELLNEIAKILEFDFRNYLKIKQPYLNSEQIKELSNKGFLFGSHSIDHPLFSDLDLSSQLEQIKESLQKIELLTKQNVRLFSFPFTDYGVDLSFFNALQQEIIPGLQASFGTAGIKNDTIPWNFQRIPAEFKNWPLSRIIIYQQIKYLAKAPFFKNTNLHNFGNSN